MEQPPINEQKVIEEIVLSDSTSNASYEESEPGSDSKITNEIV